MERKILFKALVGSHNYNLHTEYSDKDYKVFVLPTFEDIYSGTMYSKETVGDIEDFNIHDFRKLEKLLTKSNVNFIEVLFSEEIINIDKPKEIIEYLLQLFEMKEDIARMNLNYFYNACLGMYYNLMKIVLKNSNFDYKSASQAYRILDFLVRYKNNDFSSFKSAIYYKDNEYNRELILNIKKGMVEQKEVLDLIKNKQNEVDNIKNYYKKELNYETYIKLKSILENILKIHLKNIL